MGKGDRRTKRGKIITGSFGVSRPKGGKSVTPKVVTEEAPKAPTAD
ncbi:MAG: ribosomal protein Thx [Bacteroidota bacterium]|jgi:ribosomal small subunit protein bTHX